MTISDEELERILTAYYGPEHWPTYTDVYRASCRKDMRAALSALEGEWVRKDSDFASGAWRDIGEAKKDGTPIWICLKDPIPNRPDLAHWAGKQFPARHPGVTKSGYDIGWNVALRVGHGGFPDDWIAGWQPLPPPPNAPEETKIKSLFGGEIEQREGR